MTEWVERVTQTDLTVWMYTDELRRSDNGANCAKKCLNAKKQSCSDLTVTNVWAAHHEGAALYLNKCRHKIFVYS